jgi:hypothetical protein
LEACVLVEYEGVDRCRAGVAADGQHHRHLIFGPGQIGVLRRRGEGVTHGARRRDQRLHIHATYDPREGEQGTELLELAGRDGGREGADLEGNRLGQGIDRGRGHAQGKARLKREGIFCFVGVDLELEVRAEGEGHGRPLDKDPRRPGL